MAKETNGIRTRVLKDGTTLYLALAYIRRDANGKKEMARKAFDTLKEARAWRHQQMTARDQGTYVKPSDEPLGVYMRTWLDGPKKASPKLRAKTWTMYDQTIRRWLQPHAIAAMPLGRLRPADLEAYYVTLRDTGVGDGQGLSRGSIRQVHALVLQALERARRDKLIVVNPAADVEVPAVSQVKPGVLVEPEDRTMQVLTRPELDHFLALAAQPVAAVRAKTSKHDSYVSPLAHDRYLALYHVLGHGGLRPGEAFALRRDDVLVNGVRVTKALVKGIKGEPWRIEVPKTKKSKRTVTLPEASMAILRQHLAEQEAERAVARDGYKDHGFLFANERGGPLNLRNVKGRSFRRLLRAAKLPPIRLYDLRHTHVTLMLAAGNPVHVVSERVGHSSPTMTLNVYAHALPHDDGDALARYEAAGAKAVQAPVLTVVTGDAPRRVYGHP